MTPEQEERLVSAFERAARALTDGVRALDEIAAGVDLLAMTADATLTAEHPPKPEPREMKVTRLPTEEDLIREQHGGEDALSDARDPIDKWTTLGPREKEWATREDRTRPKDPPDGAVGADGPDPGKIQT